MTRHILEVDDLSRAELETVLDLAGLPLRGSPRVLDGRGVALVFSRPSARTRNATEMAVVHLGGHPVVISGAEVGLDERETAEDVARTLACYHAVICARVADHRQLVRMAAAVDGLGAPVPIVNLLSDQAHPCQALADILTLRQHFGDPAGRTVAYVGDANNVWRSLAIACGMTGVRLRTACPAGYGPEADDLARVAASGGATELTDDPAEAVAGVDAIYTDVWTSMGQEAEQAARREAFAGFCVDDALLARADPAAVVLHCLPAHRGEEISSSVLEGPRSLVWVQASNRMRAVQGLLAWLAGRGPGSEVVGS